jgi:carbamate kinase
MRSEETGTYDEQLRNAVECSKRIAALVANGYRVVLVHGNGPQVGTLMIQNEESCTVVPPNPLHSCVAQTQGQMGHMLQMCLGNALAEVGKPMPVITVLTQSEVDRNDPAFGDPFKPVGPFYSEQRARRLMRNHGFRMVEDSGRGWRRVVPSPEPKRILESAVISNLVESGALVIAAGGGGIPVVREPDGTLHGIDAVIDKDLAAQQLAHDLNADLLVILTNVDKVAINYRQPNEQWLDRVSTRQMRVYQGEGHFQLGNMGTKVEAAVRFVESAPGRRAAIGRLECLAEVLAEQTGTWIHPETVDLQ